MVHRRVCSKQVYRRASRRRLTLRFEPLEQRCLLAGDPWAWFQSFDNVPRIQAAELASEAPIDQDFIGPRELVASEWIVQLNEEFASSIRSLDAVNGVLDQGAIDFTVINGLGSSGLILVRGVGMSTEDTFEALDQHDLVSIFSENSVVEGQLNPGDPDFQSGLLSGLDRINAPAAWDETRGSTQIVTGVIDGGIDPTHPDLYLNIWLNQGELPSQFLDDEGPKLEDIDGDGLITFYDLNNVTVSTTSPFRLTFGGFASGPNASFVVDKNENGRIDAIDLLEDANWAEGADNDGNGFSDDFFGVNFRSGSDDPFAVNNPSDELGHGTHVAGTIGAIGNNDEGVVGVNWQTSLMSLRILDNNNQGDSAAAILAVNYARQMRDRYTINEDGRVTEGANVKVLNNSFGQPGGFEISLEAAIQDSNDAGILYVAAAGNGNLLGNGVDNDGTPFYPASYEVPNVIAVAASNDADQRASFSNFGDQSVDLLAPGVGIRSTKPGGGYQIANGTSMATPHVSGTAALIWSAFPEATVDEVRDAILGTVDTINGANEIVSTGGRLNASAAITANVFAPAAQLVSKQNVTTSGGTSVDFTVQYSHRSGISLPSLDGDELIVTRQWGPADAFTAALSSTTPSTNGFLATYTFAAPEGTWDALDFGEYRISTVAGSVQANSGDLIEMREIGSFNVKIENDPSVLYVDRFDDSLETGSLRSAIIAANSAAPAARTIILDSGLYTINIPAVVDPVSDFGSSLESLGLVNPGGWSDATSGDFDVTGRVSIVGDTNDETIIDAQALDRVFKVDSGAALDLSRLAIQAGVSPSTQGGGGILSLGDLDLDSVIARENVAVGPDELNPIFGGAIAAWHGTATLNATWLTENASDFGGGIYYGGAAGGEVQRSTFSDNHGGGLYSQSSTDVSVANSTFSDNDGGLGAIANGDLTSLSGFAGEGLNTPRPVPTLSADGRFVSFLTIAGNLDFGDTNNQSDVFVYDRDFGTFERVTVSETGQAQGQQISADGRYVAFAENSVIFLHDRVLKTTVQISSTTVSSFFQSPAISADGNFVSFIRRNTSDGSSDLFIFDRVGETLEQTVTASDNVFSKSISGDGRFIAFASSDDSLVSGDGNGVSDIFVYDRLLENPLRRVTDSQLSSSFTPSLSGDGSRLAYGESFQIFVVDLVSATPAVQYQTSGRSPSLSANGQFVTYTSSSDVLVRDLTLNVTEVVSVSNEGVPANDSSSSPTLSGDGRYVTFESDASNLAPGDLTESNSFFGDVFVYDRLLDVIEPISYRVPQSVINVSHVTITGSSSDVSVSAAAGNTLVRDSLFAANAGVGDLDDLAARGSQDNVFSTSQSDLIAPLQRVGNFPPVHPLLAGTPAIGVAVKPTDGTEDQLGQIRVFADHGAVEATTASVRGKVFIDGNRNGMLDAGEVGIAGVPVSASGLTDISQPDNLQTPIVNETGDFALLDLNSAEYQFILQPSEGFDLSIPEIEVIKNGSRLGNNFAGQQDISGDGRYIAFFSNADNLIAEDNNDSGDVFVYDRLLKTIGRVSETVGADGESLGGNSESRFPSISDDGIFVAFTSSATNLTNDDTNGFTSDPFVWDRRTKVVQRVNAVVGDGASEATLSGDGQFLATATSQGIALFSRVADSWELSREISFTGPARDLSLSTDGSLLVFASGASGLDAADTNDVEDVFLYDRINDVVELVSEVAGGNGGVGFSSPSISGDGQFVTFSSLVGGVFRWNRTTGIEFLFPGGFNVSQSIDARYVAVSAGGQVFVHEPTSGTTETVSVSSNGTMGNDFSFGPVISADGSFISFLSRADNLVQGDTNNVLDVFVTLNPLIDATITRDLQAGDVITDLNLGLVADPGTISGLVFEDVVPNGVFDVGEPVDVAATVFLDLNGNSLHDEGEPSTTPDAEGQYLFTNVDAFRSHTITIEAPVGFERIEPSSDEDFVWNIFLPAGGQINDRDFAIRRVNTTAQSTSSSVSGRLYEDKNNNGTFDAGDVPQSGREVFLDASNVGVRDSNELRTLTDSQGRYVIPNVSARTVAVSATLDPTLVHVSPLGSDFELQKFPLFGELRPFGNPQAIATGDFNADGFEDVAVILGEANQLNIRLNDQLGGFRSDPIDIDLGGQGAGPTSLVVGQFDDDAKLDVAITANFASNVFVLLNFDPATMQFAQQSTIQVGEEPLDLVAGQFGGDAAMDLVVLNKGNSSVADDSTVQILLNNGSGDFAAGNPIATGGDDSASLVAGSFTGNEALDLAIAHASPAGNTPNGSVTVLRGDGAGSLILEGNSRVEVGALPSDAVTEDFDGDGLADLAVVNFSSNSISILRGQPDGSLRLQEEVLGTARGAVDIVVGDIEQDGDVDILVSNLLDRNISIFRNVGVDPVSGDVRFEPLENIGLGQFALAQRMPLAVADFDSHSSTPGTLDIVAIPRLTETIHLLKNTLVDGAHRVELTGTNEIVGLDFVLRPAELAPALDPISNPNPIIEDSPEQIVILEGIAKGRTGDVPLMITAESDDPQLIPNPVVDHQPGSATASLRYTPAADSSGSATITVTVVDAGADQSFGTDDDVEINQRFVVSVLSVGDQAIALNGSGNTFFLSQPDSQLDSVRLIDIRGTGDNTLMLDAGAILSRFTNGEILVRSDSGDEVVFDDDWNFIQAFSSGGELVRQFVNRGDGATLNLIGPSDYGNPISAFDVDANGAVTSLDALQVINELGRRLFSDANAAEFGAIREVAEVDLGNYRFYDVSLDDKVTSLDALRIINQLGRQSVGAEAERFAVADVAIREERQEAFTAATGPSIMNSVFKLGSVIEPRSTSQSVRAELAIGEPATAEEPIVELVDEAFSSSHWFLDGIPA